MKMTNKGLVNLWNVLYNIPEKRNTRFAYALLKTKQKLELTINGIQRMQIPPKKFAEYDLKRYELCKKHAEKDDQGKPRVTENSVNFVFTQEGKALFEEELAPLKEEYKEAIEAMEEKANEVKRFLDEEVDFEPHKIRLENCPQDMTPAELEGILPLIVDEDEQAEISLH